MRFCLILLFTLMIESCLSNHIIVIEGMPASGKTTSLLSIVSNFDRNYLIIPELNLENNSSYKNSSIQELGDIFHSLWVDRMQSLKILSHNYENILLDRSYLSNLAFSYAMDKLEKTNYYPSKLKAIVNDFDLTADFSMVIVFDVSPKLSLERREKCEDRVPWPFSDIVFLQAFQKFYQVELRNIYKKNIIYINTDNLSQKQVLMKLLKKIKIVSRDKKYTKKIVTKEEEKKLKIFADKNNLGKICSEPLRVFNFPTIYYRKQCIQLDSKGETQFFNNDSLRNLAKNIMR